MPSVSKQDALNLIKGLNNIQREVRPVDFDIIAQNPILVALAGVANGQVTVTVEEAVPQPDLPKPDLPKPAED